MITSNSQVTYHLTEFGISFTHESDQVTIVINIAQITYLSYNRQTKFLSIHLSENMSHTYLDVSEKEFNEIQTWCNNYAWNRIPWKSSGCQFVQSDIVKEIRSIDRGHCRYIG